MSSAIGDSLLEQVLPREHVDNIIGVILVCLIIAAFLYGMSSSQAYMYYDRFPGDPWGLKLLVAAVWALDTFHTALMSHTVYYYTITHFGDHGAFFRRPVFSFNLEVVVVPLIALMVQIYFAYRAWSLNRRNLVLSGAIAAFAITQLGFGLACAVLAFDKIHGFPDLDNWSWILISWLGTAAVSDVLVTVSLVWTFYTSKTTFTEEDGFMTKVLMYGVHTGLFTSITTILDLITVSAWKGTLVFTGLNYILGKLYTNTLLYALNRRAAVAARSRSNSRPRHHIAAIDTMPTFTQSAPKIIIKDPYARDSAHVDDKHRSFDEEHTVTASKVKMETDQVSMNSDISVNPLGRSQT